MLDPWVRRALDPPLRWIGHRLAHAGVRANHLTVSGLAVGLLAVPALSMERYDLALATILANRVLDGLDGAVARASDATDFGGYLDIVCDMVFYGAVVLGFALARPENGVWAALVLASFLGTSSSFLAWAILAAKKGLTTEARGPKAFFYSAGLIEGTETVLFFMAMCIFPQYFKWISIVLAALCGWTVVARIAAARATCHDLSER